jgi:predicted glycoside hydrolase/deacetylase ChbG (UPF0249 family)
MLIINADDWGGWRSATDVAWECFRAGRITSATAMVFMEDSERAAAMAGGTALGIGLHVNFNQSFTAKNVPSGVAAAHERIRRFLRLSKLSQLVYHPGLRTAFADVFRAQQEEFVRLYGRGPTHIDGHQHMHLCMNALLGGVLPEGSCVRRSFSFWPGEKSALNRAYRHWVDRRLERRHVVTDYFFAMSQCLSGERADRVYALARTANVELMTHPEKPAERERLLSVDFGRCLSGVRLGTYAQLAPRH